MKKTFLMALGILVAFTASAQERLTLRKHVLDSYHSSVEKALGSDRSQGWAWGVQISPSFDGEHSVYCRINDMGVELFTYTAVRNMWFARNDKKAPKVNVRHRSITRAQASKLSKLFRMAIENATTIPDSASCAVITNPDGTKRLGGGLRLAFDGTGYVFFFDNFAAECHSPWQGTCHDLTEIADLLYRYVNEKDNSLLDKALELTESTNEKLFSMLPHWYQEYLDVKGKTNADQNAAKNWNQIAETEAEIKHLHLFCDKDSFILEMAGKKVKVGMEDLTCRINETNSRNLMIIDDGRMRWKDAIGIIRTAQNKKGGRVTVLTDESDNLYWKERGISRLLTAIPFSDINADGSLKEVAEQLNAGFTSDLEKDGQVILNPESTCTLDTESFSVFEIIRKSDELLVLYKSGLAHNFSLFPKELAVRTSDKVYDLKSIDGFADWTSAAKESDWKLITHCDMKCEKVFCAHFPAIPDETAFIDILEKESGRILVENLSLTGEKPESPERVFMAQALMIGHDQAIINNTYYKACITANCLACYKDKTVLTLVHQQGRSSDSAFSLGSNAEFELNGGRTLHLKETIGKPLVKNGKLGNLCNSISTYVFQLVFEPMTESEIAELENIEMKAAKTGIPDYRKKAEKGMDTYPRPKAGKMSGKALGRLSGTDSGHFIELGMTLDIDIYPKS